MQDRGGKISWLLTLQILRSCSESGKETKVDLRVSLLILLGEVKQGFLQDEAELGCKE